ncbi:MAG: atpB [Geminicoccaceae bacterium]|nr:atpB [Geminicoccaceae bacterium]
MAGENEAPKFKDFDARMHRLRDAAGLSPDEAEPRAARSSIGGTGVQVGIELVAGVFGAGPVPGDVLSRRGRRDAERVPPYPAPERCAGAAAEGSLSGRHKAGEWRKGARVEVATAEHSPLEQFEIHAILPIRVGDLNLSFTNSSLWMAIAVLLIYGLVMMGSRHASMVPGRLQSLVELSYQFIADMLGGTVGKEGRRYFPFVFTLFMFVLFGNLLGMIPGSFTYTSHIIVTFSLAIFVVGAVTVIGFVRHGWHFFSFFAPSGCPIYVMPLLVPIEILSYLIRPISLSVRLFVNMMAGHIMLKTFAGFIVALGSYYVVPGIAPLALTIGLTGLELAIAFLQAYVFTVLTCIYLQDAIHLH